MAGAAAPAPPAKASSGVPAFKPDTTPLPADVVPKQGSEPAKPDGSGDGAGAIARMLGGLAVVLLVIYGVYWLLKTVGRSRSAGGDGRIEVLSTTSLASNRSLHLVRIGDDVLLVGASEQSVTPIARYGLDELRRGGLELEPATPGGRGEAETALGRILDELRRRSAR